MFNKHHSKHFNKPHYNNHNQRYPVGGHFPYGMPPHPPVMPPPVPPFGFRPNQFPPVHSPFPGGFRGKRGYRGYRGRGRGRGGRGRNNFFNDRNNNPFLSNNKIAPPVPPNVEHDPRGIRQYVDLDAPTETKTEIDYRTPVSYDDI
eukprot:TRINITY_DN5165_c0_g1_i1.p1 TRINITY_DN5165_c0_g1~~TRINITY_DN5165_c0_g1_i1.p1  ORF type:complete len:146 (+),score=71.91 TRINITY_DN5165_c0_g1_i1:48-485(+)